MVRSAVASPIHAVALIPLLHPSAVHVPLLAPTSTHCVYVVMGHDSCMTSPVTGEEGPVLLTVRARGRGGHGNGVHAAVAGVSVGDHAPYRHCEKGTVAA